jgi:hypothetical protein
MRAIIGRTLVALLALGLLASAGPAAAQGGDRVEQELRRTDQGLERAREIVSESGSERARTLLRSAAGVQETAWGQFHGRRWLHSLSLTREARQIAARAVVLARQDQSLEVRARREVERAERDLGRAAELAGDRPSPQVEHLLRESRGLIERGRVEYHEQHYEAALRLALSARRLVRQAVGLSGGDREMPRVLRELERTENLLERVGPVVRDAGDEDALRALERGESMQASAWTAYRDGNARLAHTQTREARGLVNRARAAVRGPVNDEAVRRALRESQNVLDRASELVREADDSQARALLGRAESHQERARRMVDDGRLRQALAEIRVARTIATRAIRLVEEGGGGR